MSSSGGPYSSEEASGVGGSEMDLPRLTLKKAMPNSRLRIPQLEMDLGKTSPIGAVKKLTLDLGEYRHRVNDGIELFNDVHGLSRRWLRAKGARQVSRHIDEVTRGPFSLVLENHFNRRILWCFSPNERVDANWGLRILSAKSFSSQTDHEVLTYNKDAADSGPWRDWYDANEALLEPARPLRAMREQAHVQASTAEHVVVDGHLAFVGGRTAIEVFDISNIARPEKVGSYRVGEQGVEQMISRGGACFSPPKAAPSTSMSIRRKVIFSTSPRTAR